MATRNAKATSKRLAKEHARAAKVKRAPGDKAALAAKAQDNAAKLRRQADKAETIVINKNTVEGGQIYIEGSKGSSFLRLRSGDSKEFRAVAAKGALYDKAFAWHKANPAPKPQARLARGIERGDAPQSAAAVRAQGKAAAPVKNGKAKAAPKAGKNKQPSRGVNRSYKLGSRKDTSRPDTWRRHMLTMIMSNKDMDSAKAAHAKSGKFASNKLDFNWANQQDYIKFTN